MGRFQRKITPHPCTLVIFLFIETVCLGLRTWLKSEHGNTYNQVWSAEIFVESKLPISAMAESQAGVANVQLMLGLTTHLPRYPMVLNSSTAVIIDSLVPVKRCEIQK